MAEINANKALLRTSHKVRRPENADVGAKRKHMRSYFNNMALYALGSIIIIFRTPTCAAQANSPTNIQSVAKYPALQLYGEGDRLMRAGDNAAALEKFKQALSLRPDWDDAKTMVEYLTQMTSPNEWLETHPNDGDAWMRVFANLINSNRLDEAREHLKKIPPDYDLKEYERAIDVRAQAIAIGSGNASSKNHNE